MIIITGASRGIGKYLFEKFSEKGEEVIGTFNTTSPDGKYSNKYFQVDISDSIQVEKWIESIKNNLSHITLLNCAGNNYNSFAHKADTAHWRNVIDVNLIGTFNVIHTMLPIMRQQGYGRIINFSSIVAQMGIPGTSAYAASKSGLWGMVKSIAVENARKGITINNLNLGYFDIGMITEVPEEFQNIIKQKIPTGNFGDPVNIFNAVKFLINSEYTNGTSIDINAGLY